MPELPEVETIRLGLQKKIIGCTIKKVELLTPKSFFGNAQDITDKKVTNIWRRAKILGIELSPVIPSKEGIQKNYRMDPWFNSRDDNKVVILFHLKMSGQLVYVGKDRFIGGHPTKDMTGELPNKSTRVIFHFSDNSKLYFNDQRRFGWVKVIKNDELRIMNQGKGLLALLGPEPLEPEFDWRILKKNLLKHKTLPIKVALLDQTVVAGIGNIYASEALFNAKIDPKTKVSDLSDLQIKRLHLGVLKSLKDGIKYGGSTRTHFVDAGGRKGYFLDYAFVYNQDKKPCKICGTIIEKFQLRGRGTYWCVSCQKE